MNNAFPGHSELENLSQVLSRPGLGLEVRRFPVTYAWVERLHRTSYPHARPVINHFRTDSLITGRIRVAQ
jgi:hypothetical protein